MSRIFSIVSVLLFFGLLSCGKQEIKQVTVLSGPMQQKPIAKVYPIVSVSKTQQPLATDFTWRDGDNLVKFSDLTKDKVVLLNFWGTWCGPCRRELPDLVEISKSWASKGVLVIGMACERGKDMESMIEKVRGFADAQGIGYINIITDQEIRTAYGGINTIPQTFVINKKGQVVETLMGMKFKEEFIASINRALK